MHILKTKKIEDKIGFYELPKTTNIIKRILKISLPAALETLLIGIIGLVDTMMVGNYGDGVVPLAAVSICQQPVFITLAASFGLNAGITAIIARRKGENDQEGAKRNLKTAIVLSGIVGFILAGIAIIFAHPFMRFTGQDASEEVVNLATRYFQIVTSVLAFNYIRMAICAALRAEGDTKLTLITNLAANILNVILNYCLINGHFGFPELGVDGAAIATAIGNFVAFVITIGFIRFKKSFLKLNRKENWKITKTDIVGLVTISIPAFVEQIFMRIGFFLIAFIVNGLGDEVIAMNAIISGIVSLAFNITDGFSIGCASLVGESLGSNEKGLSFAYARLSQIISFALGTCMISLILLFRVPVSRLFSNDTNVIEGASNVLNIAVFVIFPQSLQWVTTGALRGAGDVKFTARTSMLSVAILRPIFSYCLCYPLGLGLLGSWIGMFIDQFIRFVINNYRLTNLKWMEIKV